MSKSDRPTAIEIISRGVIFRNDHILLCRNTKHGYFYLPGGHVEFDDDSAEAALSREILEETGLKSHVRRLLLVTEERFVQRDKPRHELNLVFEAQLFHVEQLGDRPPPNSLRAERQDARNPPPAVTTLEEGIDFHWLSAEALESCEFKPVSIKQWLLASPLWRGKTGPDRTDWISSSGR